MGVYLFDQPIAGATLHLLQNAGPCQDVSIPAMTCKQNIKQYVIGCERRFVR